MRTSLKPPPLPQHRLPAKPDSVRLVRPEGAQGPVPPVMMGLASWSDDPNAKAIAIELLPLREARTDRERAVHIAQLLPSAETLADGTMVFVLGDASSSGGFMMRLLKRDRESISRAARATALLARGFTKIAAAHDDASGHDLVWGLKP